jgi:hypothetical protein
MQAVTRAHELEPRHVNRTTLNDFAARYPVLLLKFLPQAVARAHELEPRHVSNTVYSHFVAP